LTDCKNGQVKYKAVYNLPDPVGTPITLTLTLIHKPKPNPYP